jgi:hypothetical protein
MQFDLDLAGIVDGEGEGLVGRGRDDELTVRGAYMTVIIVEPLADLAVLAGAKGLHHLKDSPMLEGRLLNPA